MHPVLSVALDNTPAPIFSGLFEDWRRRALPLGDPHVALVLCADGALLACRYMQTGELLDSIRTARLLPLMVQLHARSPWSYLMLDGKIHPDSAGHVVNNGNTTGWDWKALQGMLLSVQEAGVGLVTLESSAHLQDQIYLLAKRDRTANRVRPPRDVLFVSVPEDILLAFPGVGEKHCAELLHFTAGDGPAALEALLNPVHPVPGVSPKIQQAARKALGLSQSLRLALVPVDEAPKEVLS